MACPWLSIHLRHCGEQKVNAVLPEQFLLHNCRACSLIVTVQADRVDRISANMHHPLSLLELAVVGVYTGRVIHLLRKLPMFSHLRGPFAKRSACISQISFRFLYIAIKCVLKCQCR
jgi:hypothetical protein